MLNSGTILFYHKQEHKTAELDNSLEMLISFHLLQSESRGLAHWEVNDY